MLEFLSDLSEKYKTLIVILPIAVLSILISFWTSGLVAALLVLVTITRILIITKDIWGSEYDAKTSVRLASLGIIYLLAVSKSGWKTCVNQLVEPIKNIIPVFSDLLDKLPGETLSDSLSNSILIIAFIAVSFINWCIRDTTAMKEHPVPLDKEFPEKTYKQRFKSFCGVLLDDINRIDRETNWSVEYYTPLDAEVEVRSSNKRLRKITDLLTAIRSDRTSQVFLVIGDPGSGKSVALRKLCRDLLKESEKTGKVPLYINLREWQPKQKWTEENPPTVEGLYDFVICNLESRGDIFIRDFINFYFKKMFDHGRLFFILDSFDEMPGVLDVNEGSWLIDTLSDVIYRFLAGTNESRGVLVSRIFRRPTSNFDAKTILEIRPFTERKIIECFEKSLKSNEPLIQRLFKQRPDLVPIARNPFTAALISDYVKVYNDLPANQAELYSSYINKRFDSYSCQEKLEENKLTKEQVIQGAIDIADVMFTTENVGIEAPIKDLKKKLQLRNYSYYEVEKIIDILKYAKLGRVGSGKENRFSFVHRRFNEYFVVQQLIKNPERVPQDAIPTDSRWRDALVLYCEVIEEIESKKIANFCWSEIEPVIEGDINMDDPRFLRMLYCLRFLKEAFRSRIECLDDFREKLAFFIEDSIENQQNLLLQKFAVEAVALLKNEDVDRIIIKALGLNNSWIDETAINSCRHLPKISDDLKQGLMVYLESFDIYSLYFIRKQLFFTFKLSNGFDTISDFLKWRISDVHCFTIGASIILFLNPIVVLFLIFIFWLFRLIRSIIIPNSKMITHTISERRKYTISERISYTTLFAFPLFLIGIQHFSSFKDPYLYIEMGKISYTLPCPIFYSILFFIFVFVLIIPIYQIVFFVLPELKVLNKLSILKKVIYWSICLLGVAFAVIFIVDKLSEVEWFVSFFPMRSRFMLIIYVTSAIILTFDFLPVLYLSIKDQLKLNKIFKSNINLISRVRIANELSTYKTPWGRLKYVEYLQKQKIKPNGYWTSEGLPNFNNDEASILLAKLEEKWLGLDR